jgi:hypothetical protein
MNPDTIPAPDPAATAPAIPKKRHGSEEHDNDNVTHTSSCSRAGAASITMAANMKASAGTKTADGCIRHT